MRIAVVIPGGLDGEREDHRIPCLQWIIERLGERHSVDVFALRQFSNPPTFQFANATVHALGPRTFWAAVHQIWRTHRRERFDVVQAFWASRPGAVGLVAARIIRRRFYVHVAGGELTSLSDIGYGTSRTWKGRWTVKTVLRSADGITVASAAMLEAVGRIGQTAKEVPLGVDLARWPVVQPPEVVDAPYRLIHVASINRVKNQEALLSAVSRLRGVDFPFHLDLIGVDTLGGELQQLASRLKLDDHVTFHGWLPQSEVRELMKRAHAMILTSKYEAGPLVVREAATCGLGTIGSAVGHIADWAPHAAIALDVSNAKQLADTIRTFLRDDVGRVRLALRAQAEAVKHDADWTVRQFEALYQEGQHSKGRGSPKRQIATGHEIV